MMDNNNASLEKKPNKLQSTVVLVIYVAIVVAGIIVAVADGRSGKPGGYVVSDLIAAGCGMLIVRWLAKKKPASVSE